MKNTCLFAILCLFLFGCAGAPVAATPAAEEKKADIPEKIEVLKEAEKEVTKEIAAVKALAPEAAVVTPEVKAAKEENKMAKTEVKKGDNIEVEYEGKL